MEYSPLCSRGVRGLERRGDLSSVPAGAGLNPGLCDCIPGSPSPAVTLQPENGPCPPPGPAGSFRGPSQGQEPTSTASPSWGRTRTRSSLCGWNELEPARERTEVPTNRPAPLHSRPPPTDHLRGVYSGLEVRFLLPSKGSARPAPRVPMSPAQPRRASQERRPGGEKVRDGEGHARVILEGPGLPEPVSSSET